jgi:hypothetical protein
MGYVYLIKDIYNNTYKIGVTKRDPMKRLQKLQTGNACKLQFSSIYECEFPYRLETMLHNHFAQYQELNEWYNLPDIAEYNKKCIEFDSIIESLKDNYHFKKNLK